MQLLRSISLKKTVKIYIVIIFIFISFFICRCSVNEEPEELNKNIMDAIYYYVSDSAGDDANAGTLDSPFKTIQRAKQAVALISASANSDIYVYITQFYFKEGDLPGFEWKNSNPQVYIMPSGRYIGGTDKRLDSYVMVSPIESIDMDKKIIEISADIIRENEDGWMSLGYGASYFLQGAKEFLTEPGEFFLDNNTHTLYYKPIENLEVIAPKTKTIIELDGANNISFEGLQIEVTDCSDVIPIFQIPPYKLTGALISISSSVDITINNCTLLNAGESAVLIYKSGSSDVKIINNHIKNSGYTAINMPDSGNTRFTIRNNLIENVGAASGYSYAFGNWGNSHIDFEHNKIDGCVGPAVFMYDGKTGKLNNCNIAYNEITRSLQFGHDLGVIYAYQVSGQNNTVNYNYIYNCGNDLGPSGQITHALYLDDDVFNFTATNNIFAGVKSRDQYFPLYVKGQNNVIYNNIIYQNGKLNNGVLGGAVTFDMDNPENSPIKNITLANNIFYLPRANYFYSIWGWDSNPWDTSAFVLSDYNMFYFPGVNAHNYKFQDTHPSTTATAGEKGSVERWRNWDGRNFDKNSLFGHDPLFIDPENGNFTLLDDSLALKLGFVNINQTLIGLYDPENPPQHPKLPQVPAPDRTDLDMDYKLFGIVPEWEEYSILDDEKLGPYLTWPDSPDNQIYWFSHGFAHNSDRDTKEANLNFETIRNAKELRIEFENEPKGPIQFIWNGDGYDNASRGQDGWWAGWNQTDNINAGQSGTTLVIDLDDMNLWNEAVSGTGMRIILGYWAGDWEELGIKSAVFAN